MVVFTNFFRVGYIAVVVIFIVCVRFCVLFFYVFDQFPVFRNRVVVVDNLIVMGYILDSLGIVEMDCYRSMENVMIIEQLVCVIRFQIPSMMVVLRICS